MSLSRTLARILGPALIVLGLTEGLNIGVFAGIPAAFVYLNGMVLFVAGVAIVQAHNRWRRGWPLLVTLVGWALVLGGLYRLAAPAAAQLATGGATYGLLAVIVAVGGVLAWKGYGPQGPPPS